MSTTTELKQISEMTASEIADMMEHGCVKMENVAPMYVRAIELLRKVPCSAEEAIAAWNRRSAAHGDSKVPQFIVRDAERAIDAATNPKGMHTNGPAMARIEASRLSALLRYAQMNSAAPAQAGSAESEREAEIVGDTRFEGWLSESITRTDSYIKQDMREAYWAGYQERAALSAQGQQSEDARDAARYRWLAARYTGWDFAWMEDEANGDPGKYVIVFNVGEQFPFDLSRNITPAIDAAMSTPSEKEQG